METSTIMTRTTFPFSEDDDRDFELDEEKLEEMLAKSEVSIKNHRAYLDRLIEKKISNPDCDPFVLTSNEQIAGNLESSDNSNLPPSLDI